MIVGFTEEMVQTYPKGLEGWRFYRIEYGGHAEECLCESYVWLPPNAKIKDLTNLFTNWQQPIYDEYKAKLGKIPERKLLRNRLRCKKCGQTIESKYRHDFVSCDCGAIFVDGGLDYMRYGGDESSFEDLSEWSIPENVTKEHVTVRVGQLWKDLDKRMGGRIVKVISVSDGKASVETIGTGRTSVLSIRRMYNHSTGWHLEKGV